MKQLSMRAKTIISFVLFAVVFTGLTLIASYCDLSISKILTKNTLPEGAYISTSVFTLFFEAMGSCPIYLVVSIAGAIWFWWGIAHKKIWLSVIAAILVFIGFFLTLQDVFKYYTEAVTASLNNGIPVEVEMKGGFYKTLISAVIAIAEGACLVFAWSRVKPETNDALFKWVFVIVVAMAGYLIVHFVKGPVGRMRFRTMNAAGDTEFTQFTNWWVSNGKRKPYSAEAGSALVLPSDQCKSFPSGHTYSAGLIYTLICLPDLVKSIGDKKWTRPVIYAVTIAFTGIVAISRIAAGAHYMSDVLFGGTLSFLFMMIGREIFIFKGEHFKALFERTAVPLDGDNTETAE